MKRGRDYVGVAVVTLCHDGKGNYLLGQRSEKCRDEHFRWDLIGSGGVDVGETLNEAVEREVKEESGADVVSAEYLGHREVFRDMEEGKTHYLVFDYKVEIVREQAFNTEPEKCLEIGWFPIDKLPDPMHSQWPAFYTLHKDKL